MGYRALAGVAQVTVYKNAQGMEYDENLHYFINDALGSRHTMLDEDGNASYMSFDPWGNRRSISDVTQSWNQATVNNLFNATSMISAARDITHRGYTGHEMLDDAGLIHMNARLYDPRVGRFLQADTIVPDPYYIQAYNRYSYVYNNPMNATDPSGHEPLTAATIAWIAAAVTVAVAMPAIQDGAMRNQYPDWVVGASQVFSCVVNAYACALGAGTLAYHTSDGSFGAAFKAAFTTLLQADISEGIGALKQAGDIGRLHAAIFHGVNAGTFASIRGGDFGGSFLASGVTSYLGESIVGIDNDFAEAFTSVALGGTVSKLKGGKFANGAISAIITWAYNDNVDHNVRRQAAQQTQTECKGGGHGVPGLGNRTPLNEEQTAALINGTLSGTGAVIAGIGWAGTGTTCGVTVVLSADAARQFSKAATGNDPLVTLATDLGATDQQAANIALGADFVTATVSVYAAYKGLLMKSVQPFTAGALGTTSLDIFSTVNTVQQLNKSVENQ